MKTIIILFFLALISYDCASAQTAVSIVVSITGSGTTTTYTSTLSPGSIVAMTQLLQAIQSSQPPSFILPVTPSPVDIGDLISKQIAALSVQSAITYQSRLTDAGVIAATTAMNTANANSQTANTNANNALKQAITTSAAITTIKTTQ